MPPIHGTKYRPRYRPYYPPPVSASLVPPEKLIIEPLGSQSEIYQQGPHEPHPLPAWIRAVATARGITIPGVKALPALPPHVPSIPPPRSIPRPPGEQGRPNSGGFNLQEVLGLEKDRRQYNLLRVICFLSKGRKTY
jgi:hypothetical protein